MLQQGAIFAPNHNYIRMKESGMVYPVSPELEKLIRKDVTEYVQYEGRDEDGEAVFRVMREIHEAPERKISTPARKPEVIRKVTPGSTKPVVQSATEMHVPTTKPAVNLDLGGNEE